MCFFRHLNASDSCPNKGLHVLTAFTVIGVRYDLTHINGLCSFVPQSEDFLVVIYLFTG